MSGLLAVGWQSGVYRDDPVDGENSAYVVLGERMERLPEELYLVWRAAHGAPDHPATRPWTAADVTALAARSQVPAAAVGPALAELGRRGLVAEVGTEGAGRAAFARRHTLVPLAEGLGNTPEQPTVFSYGFAGRPLVQLPRMLYETVALAHRWPDLSAACTGLAGFAAAAGLAQRDATDADRLLASLVGALPVLCSLHVVHLAPAATR